LRVFLFYFIKSTRQDIRIISFSYIKICSTELLKNSSHFGFRCRAAAPQAIPLSETMLKSHYEILSSKHRVPITQFKVAQHSQLFEFYILSYPIIYNPALILSPRTSLQLLFCWKAYFKSRRMTIQVSNESPFAVAETLNSTPSKQVFLVIYASLVNGSSWCPGCRKAEPIINKKFSDIPDVGRIVYVGQKEE
jgi:hypothetical protein